jgi:hypothetical protein
MLVIGDSIFIGDLTEVPTKKQADAEILQAPSAWDSSQRPGVVHFNYPKNDHKRGSTSIGIPSATGCSVCPSSR